MTAVFSGYVRWYQLCTKLLISYSASGKSGLIQFLTLYLQSLRTPHSCHNTIESRSSYVMLPFVAKFLDDDKPEN